MGLNIAKPLVVIITRSKRRVAESMSEEQRRDIPEHKVDINYDRDRDRTKKGKNRRKKG